MRNVASDGFNRVISRAGSLNRAKAGVMIAETVLRIVKPGAGQFKRAIENCKVAGKLLACYLALRRGINKS